MANYTTFYLTKGLAICVGKEINKSFHHCEGWIWLLFASEKNKTVNQVMSWNSFGSESDKTNKQ